MISRRFIAAVVLLCAMTPAHAQKTKAQLNSEIGVLFPDNGSGVITPQILRNVTSDMVNAIMPTAPVSSGNIPSFNGSTGLLQDSGVPAGAGIASQNACTRMWPSSNFIGNWNVVDAYGHTVSTSGSTSQGLQEAINFAINNGQCLQVYGQGTLSLGSQSATLNSTTTVTGLTSTASLLMGDYVVAAAGNGIPAFTRITSIDSATQIHISNAATTTGTRTLTFTRGAGANRNSQISSSATITIPPVEQWTFQAYDVNLTLANTVNGPGIQFDSAIIVGFDWVGGQIVYEPNTPTANSFAILVAPTNPVPLDGILVFGDSHIFFSNNASPASGGAAQANVGFNIAGGGITGSKFSFLELNGTGTGSVGNTTDSILVFGATPTTAFENNVVEVVDSHLSLGAAIQIGLNSTNAGSYRNNLYKIGGIKPAGASSAGISTFGSYDTFEVGSISNEQGTLFQGINFQAGSVGNKVSYGQIIGAGTSIIDSGTCNSFTGANGSKLALFGSASGCWTLKPPNTASGVFTPPNGTTDFTATGGAGQFVKQNAAGAALTVVQPAVVELTGFGTGVATALGVNVGTAGAPVVNGGALGTPSSGTLTNETGLPISTGVSGLGTSVAGALGNNLNATNGLCAYQVGTWTPAFTGSGTAGTGQTYTLQVGSYEVCGRSVTAHFSLQASSLGTAAGNIQLSGLPFTAANTANDFGSCFIAIYSSTGLAASNVGLGGLITANTALANIFSHTNSGGNTSVTTAQAGATFEVIGSCFYHT